MRPQQIDALDGLYFRREQIVVSFVAGTELAVIAGRVAPASRICRAVPLPPVRFRKGPIAMFPADPLVDALLAPLGDLIVPDREADLAAIAHASAMMSSFYAMQNEMADWLRSRGLASDAAALYVGSTFSGLAELALGSARDGEPLRPEHHETEGGLNECGRGFLVQGGLVRRDRPRTRCCRGAQVRIRAAHRGLAGQRRRIALALRVRPARSTRLAQMAGPGYRSAVLRKRGGMRTILRCALALSLSGSHWKRLRPAPAMSPSKGRRSWTTSPARSAIMATCLPSIRGRRVELSCEGRS